MRLLSCLGFEWRNLMNQERIGEESDCVVNGFVSNVRPKQLSNLILDAAGAHALPRIATHPAEGLFENTAISPAAIRSCSQVVHKSALHNGAHNQVAHF